MKKIITSDSIPVDDNKISTVYLGNVVEVITSNHIPDNLNKFRKVSKTTYVDTNTGEVKQYKKIDNRSYNLNGVQRSLAKLRRIINLNFVGDNSERFLTLTYSYLMVDSEKIYKDFKSFVKALRKYHSIEYIAIVEPQSSGSFHIHALLKSFTEKNLDIEADLLDKLWHHGIYHIERLPFKHNFGAYFAVRVTDLYVDYKESNTTKTPKSIIKGGRLHFYPPGFRIYRCSRGIKKTTAIRMTYGEVKALTNNMKLCYSSSKQIVDVDDDGNKQILNIINYEQYTVQKEKE
ncbi:MAG: hypothetical protein ACI3XA_02345 [Clostridia bacterium]